MTEKSIYHFVSIWLENVAGNPKRLKLNGLRKIETILIVQFLKDTMKIENCKIKNEVKDENI